MKKIVFSFSLVLILIFIILFIAPPIFLIHLQSNVPISLDQIFPKLGSSYLAYVPKLPVKLKRSFLSVYVKYNEPVYGSIKFIDGTFAITKKGNIIKPKGLVDTTNAINASIQSERWDNDYKMLFTSLLNEGLLENVKSFEVKNGNPAFYDKSGILVIIGNLNCNDKILEYKEVLKIYKNKLKNIKEVDLRFENEAIVRWREL
jgi:hypothetical protein